MTDANERCGCGMTFAEHEQDRQQRFQGRHICNDRCDHHAFTPAPVSAENAL